MKLIGYTGANNLKMAQQKPVKKCFFYGTRVGLKSGDYRIRVLRERRDK